MNKCLFALILMFSLQNIYAQDSSFDSAHSSCSYLSSTARMTMEARQQNLPVEKVLKIMLERELGKDSDAYKRIVTKMVFEAYDTPRYTIPSISFHAIQDFENKMYSECMKDILNIN